MKKCILKIMLRLLQMPDFVTVGGCKILVRILSQEETGAPYVLQTSSTSSTGEMPPPPPPPLYPMAAAAAAAAGTHCKKNKPVDKINLHHRLFCQ